MKGLFSLVFLFTFSIFAWSQQTVFLGRVDMGRDLASFETNPPVKGTLYLLAGAAGSIRILSSEPFVAEVDFVQGEWKDEDTLASHHVLLRFEGDSWAKIVVFRKPQTGAGSLIYPYRKFQVAATSEGAVFKVQAVPLLF